MDFLMITLANLIWILYSMSEGVREGFYNYYQLLSRRKNNTSLRRVFTLQRSLVLLTTAGIMFLSIGSYFIPLAIGQLFMFRYFFRKSYDKTIEHLKIKDFKNSFSKLPEIMDNKKNELVMFGVSLQVFIYIFFIV
jgi:hypothetical protein